MGIRALMQSTAPVERIPVQDRSRDMGKMLREATDRGDPVDEIIGDGMRQIVGGTLDADQYGKRQPRYEHEDVVLSNEYLMMISHIDSTMDDLFQRFTALRACATKLTETLRDRVIELTVLVSAEKAVVADLQSHFKDLASRITETRNAQTAPAPAPRSNGNGSARANGGGEQVGEELRHAPDEEGARAPQAQVHR